MLLVRCGNPGEQNNVDVCVYGGTSSGVIAAYTAAMMGKKVILIEQGERLGGLTAGGLGYTDIGNKYAISGISRDFYRKIGKHYGKFEQWTFEPHVAESLFIEYASHPNITILYNHHVVRSEVNEGSIRQIFLTHSRESGTDEKSVKAKIFIDCSYEGDLMAKSGVSYVTGRESNDVYKEKYNGVQLMDGHQFPDGVDPYKIPGDASSGLLWGIDTVKLKASGSGDSSIQAYNFRICLTNRAENRREITRPDNYDSSKYELMLRLFNAQPNKRKLNDYFIISRMPNDKTDINNRGGFSSDMIGMNHRYPEAGYDERKQIIKAHEDYTKGMLYFLGHDGRVPQELRTEMLSWGYPKDEYTKTDNWTPQLYVRETRRMVGEYVMTQHNCEGREVVKDTIGFAAYTMDSHNCQRLVVNGMVKNEGNVEVGGFGPYPIAYRSILPRRQECTNLLVPVCLSASHIAYGSIRMEPVFMVLAQSAAVAACMAIDNDQPVQNVDITQMQELIRKNPLMDASVPDILLDNDNTAAVAVGGNWRRVTNEPALGYTGNYGPSMMIGEHVSGQELSATFTPVIKVEGEYEVFSYVPKIKDASQKTIVEINNVTGTKEVEVNSGNVVVEGQTSGEWASLGTYHFPEGNQSYVKITNKNADGVIVADAVLLVHAKKR